MQGLFTHAKVYMKENMYYNVLYPQNFKKKYILLYINNFLGCINHFR